MPSHFSPSRVSPPWQGGIKGGFAHTAIKTLLPVIVILLTPLTTFSATFDNPLGNTINPVDILIRLISWVLGLSALISLLAFVIGGTYLIVGGLDNEQSAARGKKIIFWAIVGLLVIGLGIGILRIIRYLLFNISVSV